MLPAAVLPAAVRGSRRVRILEPSLTWYETHETHLSAKEAQARTHSRFPRSDEYARGAPDAQATARQGPQAPHGLMGVARSARPRPGRSRLSRSAEFDRVFRQGRSHAGRDLVLYVFPRGGDEPSRLGLSVSRKVGGAVERNRVKRLLREAFAQETERMAPGTDLVVVARQGARELAEREGLAGIHRALAELIDRAMPSAAVPADREPAPMGAHGEGAN
jgi:ribonuclease P protein component